MATDPVSAFLAGFQMVDQIETNRQNRQFASEQQSYLRKVWANQEQQWARDELKYIQGQRREQFEGYASDLMDELELKSEEVYKAELQGGADENTARNKQAEWLIGWYGDDAEDKFFNEVIRRWGQADPEALEHLVLSHGRDPAAGSLVNRRNPVANVGLVPKEFGGSMRLFAELNRADGGRGPLTKFRTDSPNDPVDFLTLNTPAMVKFFGPEFRTMKTPMIMRLKRHLDTQEGALQGNPFGNVDPDNNNAAAGGTAAGTGAGSVAGVGADGAGAGGSGGSAAPPGTVDLANGSRINVSDLPEGITPEQAATMPAGTGTAEAAPPEAAPVDSTVVGEDRWGNKIVDPRRARDPAAIDRFGRRVPTGQEIYADVGLPKSNLTPESKLPDDWKIRAARGIALSAEWIENEQYTVTVTPASAKETPPGAPTLNMAIRGESGSAQAPQSEQEVQEKAQQVAEASASKRRVPFRHELYNAASLKEGGYITEEDFRTFARTGKLPENVQWQMFQIGGNIISAGVDKNSGELKFGGALAMGGNAVDRDALWKDFENFQSAADKVLGTIEDDQVRQSTVNQLAYAMQLAGLDQIAITSPLVQNTYGEAGRLFAGVDPDKQQGPWDKLKRVFTPGKSCEGFDWLDLQPFKDPGVYYGGAGLAMTAKMVQAGTVEDSQDVGMAMEQYQDHLPSILRNLGDRATDTDILNQIERIEKSVKAAEAGTLDIKTPEGQVVHLTFDKDAYPAKIRTSILDELEKIYGGYYKDK